MPYPIISKAEARSYLVTAADDPDCDLPAQRFADDGPDLDWDALVQKVAARLLEIADKHLTDQHTKGTKIKGADFEAAAAPAIHALLPDHPALADPEFWIWLAIVFGRDIVDRRYQAKRNPENFGVGGAGENLFYRLWLRGEIAFDATAKDRYALARLGDIDFWRSHIFRQGYGDVRSFARALIAFQFPSEKKGGPRLKIAEIRQLAKQLKRARTNLMFELMSGARAVQFIESEWGRLVKSAT